LTEQNIKLTNQLQDTKEMLFEAERSLAELNVKVIAQIKENSTNKDQVLQNEELKAQLTIEREESANLKKVAD